MSNRILPRACFGGALVTLAASAASAGTAIPATVVASEIVPLAGTDGLFPTNFNSAVSTPNGTIVFTGTAENGGSDNFVWSGSGVAQLNSDLLPVVVTGAESRSGGSDAGDFLYSPSTEGNDSVRNAAGLVLAETQIAPVIGSQFITFCSRPTMTASGVAYWVSGLNPTDPDGSTQARVLYRFDGGSFSVVNQSGDVLPYGKSDFSIAFPAGVDFDYGVSPDGTQVIQTLLCVPSTSADDGFVAVNGNLIAREGDPNGSAAGDNWDNFDAVVINDAGDHAFSGDTDGDTASDEFVAWNGAIAVREGDMVGGMMLASGVTIRGLAVNNVGQVCHAWGSTAAGEVVFLGDGDDLAATSIKVVATGDLLDVTGDGVGDLLVTDLGNSTIDGGQIGLDDAGNVTVVLTVSPDGGASEYEAMVAIATAAGDPCPADLDGSGDVGFGDLTVILASWDAMGGPADLDGSGTVGFGDLTALLAAWGPCP